MIRDICSTIIDIHCVHVSQPNFCVGVGCECTGGCTFTHVILPGSASEHLSDFSYTMRARRKRNGIIDTVSLYGKINCIGHTASGLWSSAIDRGFADIYPAVIPHLQTLPFPRLSEQWINYYFFQCQQCLGSIIITPYPVFITCVCKRVCFGFVFVFSGDPPSTDEPVGPYPTVVHPDGSPRDRVLVVQDYTWGKYLGLLRITFDDEGKITKFNGNPIVLDANVEEGKSFLFCFLHYTAVCTGDGYGFQYMWGHPRHPFSVFPKFFTVVYRHTCWREVADRIHGVVRAGGSLPGKRTANTNILVTNIYSWFFLQQHVLYFEFSMNWQWTTNNMKWWNTDPPPCITSHSILDSNKQGRPPSSRQTNSTYCSTRRV